MRRSLRTQLSCPTAPSSWRYSCSPCRHVGSCCVGSNGTARPSRLVIYDYTAPADTESVEQGAAIRDTSGVDSPIELIGLREYQDISDKLCPYGPPDSDISPSAHRRAALRSISTPFQLRRMRRSFTREPAGREMWTRAL